MRPQEIETRSMEIIEEELGERAAAWPPEELLVVKRCIHTSADFDYGENLVSPPARLRSPWRLSETASPSSPTPPWPPRASTSAPPPPGGGGALLHRGPGCGRGGEEAGNHRSAVCMERAGRPGLPVIAAVGNAPTALMRIKELAEEGRFRPELVIGVPVGFVNVVEAKEMILGTDIPHIVARGRKGGSNIAAAIVNALLYQVRREE